MEDPVRALVRVILTTILAAMMIVFIPATGGAILDLRPLLPAPEGIFTSECPYSHRLPDDPIVRPAQPGASHSHDFFGNRTTNAFSTYESLRAGGTTCTRRGDTAAYWVPTLYDRGVAVRPSGMSAYYMQRGKRSLSIQPFPAGLRIVAGDASATRPQPTMVTVWTCGERAGTESSSVPLCALGSLQLHVRFPDCWNGRDLDFPDHRSHMAYSMGGACPAGYPVALPGLQINIFYPVRGGPTVTLSSGSGYTAHGDFFNAWDQAELARQVRDCLNIPHNCN